MDNVETLISVGNVAPNESACPSMSFKERLIGFVMCWVLGIVLSLISWMYWGRIIPFCVLLTLGNILSLLSSMFFSGPAKQFKNMTKPTRLITSIVLVVSIVATILCCIFLRLKTVEGKDGKTKKDYYWWGTLIIISLAALQYCSMFWYNLSYIPFARKLFKKICKCCFCSKDDKDDDKDDDAKTDTSEKEKKKEKEKKEKEKKEKEKKEKEKKEKEKKEKEKK